jgi:cytochrome c-type biogenesis protein CcmH/NrfF
VSRTRAASLMAAGAPVRLAAILLAPVLLALACAPAGGTPTAMAHPIPRVSLPVIERQAMCVTCKVALNESQSPQADSEREYIKELIAEGDGEAQIKRSLVAQYGPTVLALPSAHGFDVTVYVVPAGVVLALLLTALTLLPSWRRRARERAATAAPAAKLSAADNARLESDLARFD